MTVLGVVGAGTMGAGIAQLGAAAGMRTLLQDPDPEALDRGAAAARTGLAKWAEKVSPADRPRKKGQEDGHERDKQQFRAHLPHLKPHIGEVGAAQKPRQQPERKKRDEAST